MGIIHHFHLAHDTSLPPSLQVSLGRLYIGELANVWGDGIKQYKWYYNVCE